MSFPLEEDVDANQVRTFRGLLVHAADSATARCLSTVR